jgi:hypothetical protein
MHKAFSEKMFDSMTDLNGFKYYGNNIGEVARALDELYSEDPPIQNVNDSCVRFFSTAGFTNFVECLCYEESHERINEGDNNETIHALDLCAFILNETSSNDSDSPSRNVNLVDFTRMTPECLILQIYPFLIKRRVQRFLSILFFFLCCSLNG